jgi:prepilin-type N-terminal cleavage/methylation domain-containing protein
MIPKNSLDGCFRRLRSRNRSRRLRGFTLLEVLVANVLLALLVILIAGAWRAFGPLCVEVIARGRIVNEANVAAAALYVDSNANPGGLSLANVETLDGSSLSFEYGTRSGGSWTHVVTYSLHLTPDDSTSTGQLIRSDGNSSVTIARNVESIIASNLPQAGQAQLSVSFAYRGSRSQYTFVVHQQ